MSFKVQFKVLPVLPVCTVAAGLPLQLVVVGGVGDVAQSHAVLPDWTPVLEETRGEMEVRSGRGLSGRSLSGRLQLLTMCLACCCSCWHRCSSSSLSGRRYSSASSTSPRSSELSRREKKRLSVGLGRSPWVGVAQLIRRVFLSESPPSTHIHTPDPLPVSPGIWMDLWPAWKTLWSTL